MGDMVPMAEGIVVVMGEVMDPMGDMGVHMDQDRMEVMGDMEEWAWAWETGKGA